MTSICWMSRRMTPIVTTGFLYVRFIGDRSIDEKTLEKFKDRISEMSNWADELKKVEKEKEKKRGRKKS
ncbi:MAG: hypothetical protein K0S91_1183 [Nitrososphaeraceae archaeon]|nr:hypothetical protein [Nitrososphaeraceae archaeon]